jgi:hypothetical protein
MMTGSFRWFAAAAVAAALIAGVAGPGRHEETGLVLAAPPSGAVEHGPGHGCSTRTLRGTFGFSFSGTAVLGGFEGKPGAVVGLMSFDGHGNVTGVVTANASGTVLRRSYEGTYTVNADCTGSVTAAALPVSLLTFQADGVIVNGGTEVLFIGAVPELVFTGIAKKL